MGDTAHAILVLDSLKILIDSVKLSSWDPTVEDYVQIRYTASREYEKSGIDG